MASPDELNSQLADQSYLGGGSCASKEDYRVCASLKSVSDKTHPHLARWHAHIAKLMVKYPNYDWRCNAVPEAAGKAGAAPAPAAKKEAPAPAAKKEAPAAKKQAAPAAAPAAAGGAIDEAAIKAIGDDIRALKEKLKGEGITGKKLNDHPDVAALVAKLSALKSGGGGAAPAAAPAKAAAAPAAAKPAAAAAAPAASGGVEAQVTAVGEEIRQLKEKLKGEGLSGGKINKNEDIIALVAKLTELKKQIA